MPLPMVHFAIAVEIAQYRSPPLNSAFLLGSIAPDAIHVRAGSNRSDKNRTHLLQTSHADTVDDRYIATIGEFVRQHKVVGEETAALTAGYAAHLLADRLWFKTIYHQFCQCVSNALTPAARTQLYYRETEQVDRSLYEQQMWRETVWALLDSARLMPIEPLVTAEEVWQYKMQKQAWYAEQAGYSHQPAFITYEQVGAFIPQAGIWIANLLDQW